MFIPSTYAGRAVPSHLCFPVAVLTKPSYFQLFLQEIFFISLSALTGFFSTCSHFTSLVLDMDGDVCTSCSVGLGHHGLGQQHGRFLFCRRKELLLLVFSMAIVTLGTHSHLVAGCLQAEDLLSCSIHFLCLVCVLNHYISSHFNVSNAQGLLRATLILFLF